MSQPYQLMAEAAESGDYRNFLHATATTLLRLPNTIKPWRGFLRDGVMEHATR